MRMSMLCCGWRQFHPLLTSRVLATILPVMIRLHGKLSVIVVIASRIFPFSRYLLHYISREEPHAKMHE
jgi:hypothetical protein